MSVPVCNHLKEDGVYCNSPALNGRKYCSFHLNLRGRRLKSARARRRGDNPPLNLPCPEDMHAVQISLAEVMWAVAEGRIDHKSAGLILYSLQQASTNLLQTPRWQGEREAVESTRPLRALSDPGFEKRFDLAPNTDLDPISTADMGGPHLPDVGKCGNNDDELCATNPDCVPIPKDEFADLKMTRAEEMEFFVYRMKHNPPLEDGEEEQYQLAWLRAKRAGTLYHDDVERENSKAFEAMYSELPEAAEPEAA